MSRAIVTLAERGVRTETEARENLKAAYGRFMKKAGKDLIRAIFGKNAIAGGVLL